MSKWESGKGYPDISLLEPIAKAFGVSVTELITGNAISNGNVSANMMRSQFYVCPVCGNVIHSMGEAVIYCSIGIGQDTDDKALSGGKCRGKGKNKRRETTAFLL